jgi:hypothetical protein
MLGVIMLTAIAEDDRRELVEVTGTAALLHASAPTPDAFFKEALRKAWVDEEESLSSIGKISRSLTVRMRYLAARLGVAERGVNDALELLHKSLETVTCIE